MLPVRLDGTFTAYKNGFREVANKKLTTLIFTARDRRISNYQGNLIVESYNNFEN